MSLPTTSSIAVRLAAKLPRNEHWIDRAPCAGKWYAIEPIEPSRQFVRNDEIVLASLPGLRLCTGCPFVRECIARVQPASSWFDGVCGGRVWRNGNVIYTLPEVEGAA